PLNGTDFVTWTAICIREKALKLCNLDTPPHTSCVLYGFLRISSRLPTLLVFWPPSNDQMTPPYGGTCYQYAAFRTRTKHAPHLTKPNESPVFFSANEVADIDRHRIH
ncbi:unnamed protein product, partial [Ectocarpus sp. 12 AP-2014]